MTDYFNVIVSLRQYFKGTAAVIFINNNAHLSDIGIFPDIRQQFLDILVLSHIYIEFTRGAVHQSLKKQMYQYCQTEYR